MTEQTPPPGWYPTDIPGQRRWWDGTQWADPVSAAPAHTTMSHGLRWGKGSPGLAMGLGLGFGILGLGALLAALLMTLFISSLPFWAATFLGILGLLFVVLAVVSLVDARAGYKLRNRSRP